MSKFTSGKWEYDKEYIFLPNGKNYQPNGFISDEEEQANARLIAAAPEMYNWLKTIAGIFDKGNVINVSGIKELLARIDGEGE